MRCPLSGKPCLMPKDVFVTEIHEHETKHLFLCRVCGEKYMEKMDNADVVTKSMEMISSDDGVKFAEHVLDEKKLLEQASQALEDAQAINKAPPESESPLVPPKPSVLPQIKKIEAKLQQAIDVEDYESAAQLRDILQALQKEQDDSKE